MINVEILKNDFIKVSANIIADSVKHQKVCFAFPEHWSGTVKTAVFVNGETVINVLMTPKSPLYVSENVYYIPHEVIKAPEFTISVFGILGDTTLTSDNGTVYVRESGMIEGQAPSEPTPSEYEQLIHIAEETRDIAQSVRDDADNGAFKGDKGDTGNTGPQGIQGSQGIQGIQGPQGLQGPQGDPFAVAKLYPSIEAMNADRANPDVKVGAYVLIHTGNVEDEDNAKLFVKTETNFSYITDMSGSAGIQGPKGDTGERGPQGEQGPQGIQGLQGVQGEKGEQGERGFSGMMSKIMSAVTNGNISVPVSTEFIIPELTGETTIELTQPTAEETQYSVVWNFTINQGAADYNVILPENIEWTLGIAPTFSANSITEVCLYYKGNVLRGAWN